MSDKIINIQDAFLNYMRKNKIPVTVFLLNGVKLNGIISCFDQSSIVVKREGYTQLVYKHAISTFSPHGAISVFDWNGPQNNARACECANQDRNSGEDGLDDEEIEDIEIEFDEDDDEDDYDDEMEEFEDIEDKEK